VAELQFGHPGVNLTRLPALPHRGHALAGDALQEKPGGEMQIKLGDNTGPAAMTAHATARTRRPQVRAEQHQRLEERQHFGTP
jgi:hypothetical protein